MKKLKKGFAMAEIVVSITLIVMLSVAGYASCTVALKSSNANYLEMQQYSDVERVLLSASDAITAVGNDHTKKTEFLTEFFQHLAWGWNCEQLGTVNVETFAQPVYFYDEGYNVQENANYGLQGTSVEHVSAESEQNANCWIITKFGVNFSTKCVLNLQSDDSFTLSCECTKNNSENVYYQNVWQF